MEARPRLRFGLVCTTCHQITPEHESSWCYGFARMSCFYLRVYRGKEIVWQRDRAPVPTPDRASPYFFRQYAQVDGSADVPVAKGK